MSCPTYNWHLTVGIIESSFTHVFSYDSDYYKVELKS